jgi:hypothetical protein
VQASEQVSRRASKQTSKQATKQANKLASKQINKQASKSSQLAFFILLRKSKEKREAKKNPTPLNRKKKEKNSLCQINPATSKKKIHFKKKALAKNLL